MGLTKSGGVASRFSAYIEGLASVIGHAGRAKPLRDYCTGLMMPSGRASSPGPADRPAPVDPPPNKSVPAIPFPKFVQQCLSLLCAVAGNGCYAGRKRHLIVGSGLTRNALPLYQHVADAILSKSICPDGEHHFGAVYDLFYQVVPGTVVWQGNKVAVHAIG